jgi:uncharacterized protein (TIGR02145 family)
MISNYAKASGIYITDVTSTTWGNADNAFNNALFTDPAVATPINGTRTCTGVGYAATIDDAITFLADSGSKTAGSIHNCGYLYNWYGATDGTGLKNLTTTIATGSICPTGWHLPSYGKVDSAPLGWASNNEFGDLYAPNASFARFVGTSSAWRGVHAGRVQISQLNNQNTHGYYWTSSANTPANYAFHLYFTTALAITNLTYDYKWEGKSVRCVLNVD